MGIGWVGAAVHVFILYFTLCMIQYRPIGNARIERGVGVFRGLGRIKRLGETESGLTRLTLSSLSLSTHFDVFLLLLLFLLLFT